MRVLIPLSGGSILEAAPGKTAVSPVSRPTPLSVVFFETAESPRRLSRAGTFYSLTCFLKS